MKHKITITFEMDPKEWWQDFDDFCRDYHFTTKEAATIAIVKDLLENKADFPEGWPIKIACDDVQVSMTMDVKV